MLLVKSCFTEIFVMYNRACCQCFSITLQWVLNILFDLDRMLPILQYCDVKDKAAIPIIYAKNSPDA